ncbi:MAG: pyrroline-5-carboxylate reductase [candidate division Zixibacteria bacterium]|nr:pyrroline-5-carboxylate reductase [candidate division Zixibacteria bacterium]
MTIGENLAIIGGGNIGCAIARGLIKSKRFAPNQIILTRRRLHYLENMEKEGFKISGNNIQAVEESDIILISVEPQQLVGVLEEISPHFDKKRHIIFSIVSGASITDIKSIIGNGMPVIRVMPNIAVGICESMTCLCADSSDNIALDKARSIFDSVGQTLVISEELMVPATALCACGIAFFFRAIRAASQGGIEIGFHSVEALAMASQTARGAAALLNGNPNHPETEIDKVTTPRGCTIAGLNNMEHSGFSSAMIRGIITSAEKAEKLFKAKE